MALLVFSKVVEGHVHNWLADDGKFSFSTISPYLARVSSCLLVPCFFFFFSLSPFILFYLRVVHYDEMTCPPFYFATWPRENCITTREIFANYASVRAWYSIMRMKPQMLF